MQPMWRKDEIGPGYDVQMEELYIEEKLIERAKKRDLFEVMYQIFKPDTNGTNDINKCSSDQQ